MGSTKKHDGKDWKKFGSTKAVDIKITDFSGNFESDNVEGALREASSKISDVEAATEGQKKAIQNHASVLAQHEEDIAWLKENGGGGGSTGNIAPTITSKFEDRTIVEKGKDVIIPIFFSSPNLGNGTAVIVIDGIEVNSVNIKAGNNNVNIGKLTNLMTEVSIYVKDRVGMLSNQLTWNIICGGLEIAVDFDSTADYDIKDTILMQYNVTSASSDPITMHMTIGYNTFEFECNQGFNEYIFENLTPGVHKVSFYATSGPYVSSTIKFNIVVVSAESLYVSTTFEGGEFDFGAPIPINYRISKLGTETFDVQLVLDDQLVKTLSVPVGSYYWTLNDISVGYHTFVIKVSSAYGEYMEVSGEFKIVEGEYTPLKVTEAGLLYRLNAKGRTNNDSDRENPVDNSGNAVKTTLHNFNYYSNGWIDNALVCDGLSYVEIDAYPWAENALYGSTIEIQYKGLDIGMYGARIFDYTDVETPYKGAYIDLEETTMKSIANTGKINLDADTWVTVSFVIDRKNKFGKIFVNGICSRAFGLSDSGSGTTAMREDFTHNQKIFLNSRKGEDKFGACEIKDVRIYNRVLSDDEIVNNYIAQIEDLQEQRRVYDLNYNNTTLPTIKMYGDTTNMTLETPVTMRIKYTSPNEDKYGQSFDLPYCEVNWQGTSSLQYVLKNFTARLKDENMANYYYTPYPNGVLEYVYCFKCDYMESTHSRNAGLAKFVNECLYDEKNPAQLKNPNVRNSINGFPTLLYINDELQGVYNFNLDRYSTSSYGYDSDTTLVYEVSANSDTTAGAFYKWSQSSGKSKLDYYKSDFECLYPPTRAAGNDNMEELIRVVEWVNDASDEDFKDNISRYFNLQYLLRYFLYVYVVGAVDSLGKNMKLASWDGLVWYPQVYDADTTLGLDNTGFLQFDMDIEMGDKHVFNTTGSMLWKRVQLLFANELNEQYALMRQKEFTVENIMKYVLEEQIEKIPARFYNMDMQTKYLNFGDSFIHALHGSSELHLRKWLRERLIYCDTLFGYTVSTADYITIRSNKLGPVYLDIQTYIPMYVRVKWRDEAGGTGVQVKRVARGETVRFEYVTPTDTDQEILVYGGYYLKSLGDLSNLNPKALQISKASRLTQLTCHADRLIMTDLDSCTKLQRIDLSNCTSLGTTDIPGTKTTLNIQNCKYLRYCDCSNTQLTAVYTMPQGGNLEELYFPPTTQIIQITNQVYLKVIGIPYYCENLSDVQIINCNNVEYIQYPYKYGDPLDFSVFKYVQNLNITNSLDKLTSMTFSGFTKLRSVTLSSLSKLAQLGFDDMLPNSEISTIQSVTIGDCPLIDKVTFNVTSNDYKVEFATGGVIDISGLQSCKTIESNYSIKGLNKILLPTTIKNVYLRSDYGDGDNHLSNLWSAAANHEKDGFTGIDFLNLDLENFRMDGCNNLTTAINFCLTPINELPALSAFTSLQGWVNFDKYVGDVRYMFRGINFTFKDFEVRFNLTKEQNDITGLFQNAVISKSQFNTIIKKFPNATIYDYFLEGSTIEEDYEFPKNAVSVVGAFKDCLNLSTYHANWETDYATHVTSDDCYKGCLKLPLEEIPESWGGYAADVMSIYEVVIPNDNYTVVLSVPSGALWNQTQGGKVTWGDGGNPEIFDISSSYAEHTYKHAGTYYIRATYDPSKIETIIKNAYKGILQRVVQETSGITNARSLYENCGILTSVTLRNFAPTDTRYMFKNTPLLTELRGVDSWDVSKVTNTGSMFYNCGLPDYSFLTNWRMDSVTDTGLMFYGTKADVIDVSGWYAPNLRYVSTGPGNGGLFQASSARKINVTGLVGPKATTIGGMFNGCSNLTEIIGMDTWDTSNVTAMEYMFQKIKANTIDISNWYLRSNLSVGSVLMSGSSIKTIIMNNVCWEDPAVVNKIVGGGDTKTNHITKVVMDAVHPNSTNFDGIFQDCIAVTNDILLPDNTTSCANAFKGCTAMTHIHDNWNNDKYHIEEIPITWAVGHLITHNINSTRPFGGVAPSYANCSYTDYIALSSDLIIKNGVFSSGVNVRVAGYDSNYNAVGLFELDSGVWVENQSVGADWAWKNQPFKITQHEKISYVRIGVDANINTGLAVTETTIGSPINSSNCYNGCISITHINNKPQVVSEFIKPIDGIPKEWGGFGLSPETTAIFVIETDTDGYQFQSSAYPNDSFKLYMTTGTFVDWGDGTSEIIANGHRSTPKHIYEKAGRYIVKGNLFVTRPGYGGHGLATGCVTEVHQYPTNKTISNGDGGVYALRNFAKLRKAVLSNRTLTEPETFMGCTKLEYVDLTGTICTKNAGASMFKNCTALKTIAGLHSDSFVDIAKVHNMFENCNALESIEFLRDVDFGLCTTFYSICSGCTKVNDITPIINNTTIGHIYEWYAAFQNVPAKGDVLDLSFMCRDYSCSAYGLFKGAHYKKVTGANGLKLKGNIIGMFESMPHIEELDISGMDMSDVTMLSAAWHAFIYDLPKLKILNMNNTKTSANLTNGYWGYAGMSCHSIETITFKDSDLYIVDTYRMFESNTAATTLDLSDLDFSIVKSANSWNTPFAGWDKVVDFYPPRNIGCNYRTPSLALSTESINRIIENLVDVGESRTLELKTAQVNKLSAAQKDAIANKGWTIVAF